MIWKEAELLLRWGSRVMVGAGGGVDGGGDGGGPAGDAGPRPRGLGDPAPGPPLRPPHDDDDGRGGPVQDQVEAAVEERHLWGLGEEDPRPHGRQGGAEEGEDCGHCFLFLRYVHNQRCVGMSRSVHGYVGGISPPRGARRLPLVLPGVYASFIMITSKLNKRYKISLCL